MQDHDTILAKASDNIVFFATTTIESHSISSPVKVEQSVDSPNIGQSQVSGGHWLQI